MIRIRLALIAFMIAAFTFSADKEKAKAILR